MPPSTVGPPFDQFLATAEAVARERAEVDLEMAREVFSEAATLLDNSLALDGLDDHDASVVMKRGSRTFGRIMAFTLAPLLHRDNRCPPTDRRVSAVQPCGWLAPC